jgi:acetyltransferase
MRRLAAAWPASKNTIRGKKQPYSIAKHGFQMRLDTARQRVQVIPPLKAGHDPPLGTLVGQLQQLARDPREIELEQIEMRHVIRAMTVEPGRDHDQLRREGLDAGQAFLQHGSAKCAPIGQRRQRHVDNIWRLAVGAHAGIIGMLETRAEQDALVARYHVLGAIAVVHVEIDDGDPLQAPMIDRVIGANRDVTEEAEAHGARALRMVTRWPDHAKNMFDRALHDQVDALRRGARGVQCGSQRVRIHGGIAIEPGQTLLRRTLEHMIDVILIMRRQQLLARGLVGVVVHQHHVEATGDQSIIDGVKTRGLFGMVGTHFVQAALGSGNDSNRHKSSERFYLKLLYLLQRSNQGIECLLLGGSLKESRMKDHYLKSIFEPESIAVVGASERADSVGAQVMANIVKGGYLGKIYPVNPKHDKVQGIDCYPSIAEIDHPVDLVIIAIPARRIAKVMEACAKHPVRAVIVLSSGFTEIGKKGETLQNEIVDIARTYNIPLLGPDCLGVLRPRVGLNATFARSNARKGHVALVAQSGAFCTALLDWADSEGFGFSSVVSLGASADIGFGDVLDYLAGDPETHSILLYVESVSNARKFISGLRVAARLKPVIIVKSGRNDPVEPDTPLQASQSIANDRVFDAAIQRAGAVRVNTVYQLFSATQTLASGIRIEGSRLAIVTNGTGPGIMAVDRSIDLGLPVATLSKDSIKALGEVLPKHWSHGNPVDILSDADAKRYEAATRIVLADKSVDGLLILLTPQGKTDPTACAQGVIKAAKKSTKPLLACWMGETLVRQGRELFTKAGIPHFSSPEAGVDAFGYLANYRRNQQALLQAPAPLSRSSEPDVEGARLIIENALNERRHSLSNTEAKAVLRAFHIPVSPSINVSNAADALVAAENLGLPVAMKINSPDLTHKSAIGGVRLNIREPRSVRTTFREMIDQIGESHGDATVHGVTIEPMLNRPHAREIMIGIVQDRVFGPVISFGTGGNAVDIFADCQVALPPLNEYLSNRLIEGTRAAAYLQHYRNLPRADLGKLTAVLQRVSEISCELPEVQELEINPLLVDENGVIAIDARIVIRQAVTSTKRYDHMAIHPYPTELESAWQLPDGANVTIRPIRPEDAEIEQVFVKKLSAESKYFRFMHGLDQLSPLMLARMTQIDYDREMALIAVIHEGKPDACIISVARYAMNPDRHSCEFALTVGDDYQGKGIGQYLMKRLMTVARDRGIEVMEGEVLSNNFKMLKLMERLEFRIVHDDAASDIVQVRRHL